MPRTKVTFEEKTVSTSPFRSPDPLQSCGDELSPGQTDKPVPQSREPRENLRVHGRFTGIRGGLQK